MTRKGIHHPIQAAVEDVYGAGHTPRLQIDARRNDVEVPESVRRTWQARLVIDLDPSYPLDLSYDANGVSVDLAFQGIVSRCRFGWRAIYAVIDRTTGRGIVVEAHLPPPELDGELVWVERQKKPRLSAVPSLRPLGSGSLGSGSLGSGSLGSGSSGSGEVRPARSVSAAASPIVPAGERPSMPSESTPIPSPVSTPGADAGAMSGSDAAAKERRSRFRVIDGGR